MCFSFCKRLVSRSKYGQLRVAEKSGHYIQRDQPELVTQATKDVIREKPETNCQVGSRANQTRRIDTGVLSEFVSGRRISDNC